MCEFNDNATFCRQILYARDVDQRSTTFEKSLQMGKEFQRRTKAMILRAAVLRNQIHVKVTPSLYCHCILTVTAFLFVTRYEESAICRPLHESSQEPAIR